MTLIDLAPIMTRIRRSSHVSKPSFSRKAHLMRKLLFIALCSLAFAIPALAQDPVKVDAKHYKLELENSQVRILRVKYGPREKSVMHSHPIGVVVYLTDAHVRFHLPGGKSEVKTG